MVIFWTAELATYFAKIPGLGKEKLRCASVHLKIVHFECAPLEIVNGILHFVQISDLSIESSEL